MRAADVLAAVAVRWTTSRPAPAAALGTPLAGLRGALLGTEPDTTCTSCREAETRPLRRALQQLRGPDPGAAFRTATVDTWLAYSGRTWYHRHRDAYVATGDPLELERMLRHVTP